MVESNAIPGFLPSVQGLHFANRWPHGPTVRFGPLDPRWVGIGDAANGLCGGMSWYRPRPVHVGPGRPGRYGAAGERLAAVHGRSSGSRSSRSSWLRTPLHFWWIGALGPGGAADRSRDVEFPRIRADIDAGRLAMVGLVRATGLEPVPTDRRTTRSPPGPTRSTARPSRSACTSPTGPTATT